MLFKDLVWKYQLDSQCLNDSIINFIFKTLKNFDDSNFIIKLDNERRENKFTLVITILSKDLVYRKDTSSYEEALSEALIYIHNNNLIIDL